jgi:hypothetical protein
LEVTLDKGTVRLFSEDDTDFLFENISGSFAAGSKNLTITIGCESNIWEFMELDAKFTPGSQEGKGTISLENFNSKMLVSYFLTDEHPLSEGLVSSLQGSFSVDPQAGLKTNIQGSGATFAVPHENKVITAKIENLKLDIQHTDEYSSLTLEDLSLFYPQVKLSGAFTFDRTIPHASLDIKAQNSDITSVREVLPVFINALFGDLPVTCANSNQCTSRAM